MDDELYAIQLKFAKSIASRIKRIMTQEIEYPPIPPIPHIHGTSCPELTIEYFLSEIKEGMSHSIRFHSITMAQKTFFKEMKEVISLLDTKKSLIEKKLVSYKELEKKTIPYSEPDLDFLFKVNNILKEYDELDYPIDEDLKKMIDELTSGRVFNEAVYMFNEILTSYYREGYLKNFGYYDEDELKLLIAKQCNKILNSFFEQIHSTSPNEIQCFFFNNRMDEISAEKKSLLYSIENFHTLQLIRQTKLRDMLDYVKKYEQFKNEKTKEIQDIRCKIQAYIIDRIMDLHDSCLDPSLLLK